MLHLKKKYHTCQCVCYYEGTLKQFQDTFHTHAKKKIKTLKILRLKFMQKGGTHLLLPFRNYAHNNAAQNKTRESLRPRQPQCSRRNQTSQLTRKGLSLTFLLHTATPIPEKFRPTTVALVDAGPSSPPDQEGPASSELSASSKSVVSLCFAIQGGRAFPADFTVVVAAAAAIPTPPEDFASSRFVTALRFVIPEGRVSRQALWLL